MTRLLPLLLLSACTPQLPPPTEQASPAIPDKCADSVRPAWMGDDVRNCVFLERLEAEFGRELAGGVR